MSFDKIFDLTAGVYYFFSKYMYIFLPNGPDMRSKSSSKTFKYFFFALDGEFEANAKRLVCLRKHIFSISDVDASHGSAALCGPNISDRLSS